MAFLRGEGDFPKEKMPDAKTLLAWLRHCSAFGLATEGASLFERGGLAGQMFGLGDEERWDADEYYQNCKRKAARAKDEDDEAEAEDVDEGDNEEEVEE